LDCPIQQIKSYDHTFVIAQSFSVSFIGRPG
jgi:hypothetical protein